MYVARTGSKNLDCGHCVQIIPDVQKLTYNRTVVVLKRLQVLKKLYYSQIYRAPGYCSHCNQEKR